MFLDSQENEFTILFHENDDTVILYKIGSTHIFPNSCFYTVDSIS